MKTSSAVLVCTVISTVLASAIDGNPALELETLQEPAPNRQERSLGVDKGREKELEIRSKYGSSVKITKKAVFNDGGAVAALPALLDSFAQNKERIINALHSKKAHVVPIAVQVQPAQPVVQYQPVQQVIEVQPAVQYQPVQQFIEVQPVQRVIEVQPAVQYQPVQQVIEVQPAKHVHPHLLSLLLHGHKKHFKRDSADGGAEDGTANDLRGDQEPLDNNPRENDVSGPA